MKYEVTVVITLNEDNEDQAYTNVESSMLDANVDFDIILIKPGDDDE